MNKKTSFLLAAVLFAFGSICFAQRGSVSVDPRTGMGSFTIPVYAMAAGQVSLPVSLVYSGQGVKPKDVEGTAGMNWSLVAGGQISRVVRGLPDDVTQDNLGNSRYGWMSTSNTAANAIAGFTIQNNGSNCSYETADISYITANFPYNYDTEPDLFYVNAPGLSCELIYDRASAKFHPVSYQDITITYGTNVPTGSQPNQIAWFNITNDKGVVYSFGSGDIGPAAEIVTESTTGGSQVYNATKYKQYQYGISYYDSWSLTNITDANGNSINLTYTGYPKRSSTDSVAYYIGGSVSSSLQYFVRETVTPMELTSILTSNVNNAAPQALTFNWATLNAATETGETVLTSITGFGRNFQLGYSPVIYSASGYTRNFLRSFTEAGCGSPINYQFAYAGETLQTNGNYTTALPDSASNKTDYWGYYCTTPGTATSQIPSVYVNPGTASYPQYVIGITKTNGSGYNYAFSNTNRTVDPTNIATGSLIKISYVQGGNTNIIYEPNDYYDTPSGSVSQGGGLRVKQVIDSVGTGAANTTTNNIIRNYSYLNPSTGLSSGKALSLPEYAFTIPYSGTVNNYSTWAAASALSAHDISAEDHTIMYGYFKMSQTGAGSTLYQFYVPATYYDLSATPGCSGCSTTEWAPTVNLIGRNNCSSTYGAVGNAIYSYPFIPNPNYDFERGLLQKVTAYTDAGGEVSEADYTYQRSFSPTQIVAFKYDDDPNGSLLVRSYNKYTLFYNTSELTATVTKTVFDAQNAGQSQTNTASFTYGSAYHKLVTQQTATNSDNSTVTTNFSYTKDYTAAAGSNANINAIYYLQQQNINVPVETYQQVTRSGTTLVTGGALTLFSGYTVGSFTHYLPSQQLKFVLPDGVATTSFSPYTINAAAQTSTYDTRYYVPVANLDQYDNTGFPVTVDDNNKHFQTSFFDHLSNHATAVFSNARYNEVAFNDFDSQVAPPQSTFTISGTGSFTPVGSHAGNAAGLAATTQTVTSSAITKNAIAQNYIFSIWINAATTGTLSFTGISTNPTIGYSAGGWAYYEMKVPVSALASPFTIAFTSNQNISIDDILLYPDVAEAATATFDATAYYKIAQTNTNGVSAYFTNDTWGRTLLELDQDKNIVLKKSYFTPLDIRNFAVPLISYTPSSSITTATPVTFSIGNPDACPNAAVTYNWLFGDGGSLQTTLATAPAHTYASAGTYTVSLTATSALLGTKTATPVSVTVAQATATVTENNYTTASGITNITFTNASHTYNLTSLPATIATGTYSVSFTPTGQLYNPSTGKGMTNVVFSDGANGACYPWGTGGSHTFSWTVNAGDTLNFSIYNNNYCPFNSPPPQ